MAMSKFGAWIFSSLLLPLGAQEVLPDDTPVPPPVDAITPVPALEFSPDIPGIAPMAMPKNVNISNYGGGTIEGVKDVGLRYNGPGIKITGDNGMEAFADSAVVDFKAESVTLQGNVSIYQGNILQRGDRAVYFYEKKTFDAGGLRASLDPILLEANRFKDETRNGKTVYVGENAGITTDDSEVPGFWVRAKKTTVFPDDKVVFNDLRVYAGDVPVFWLPYLSQPLDSELGYHFLPGARSSWGPFLLNTYGVMLGGNDDPETGGNQDAWLLSRWRLDLRAERGVGVGLDLVDTRLGDSTEITGLSLYYLYDLSPDTSTTGIPRGDVDPNRYKIELKDRREFDFADDAEWRLDSNLNLLSDEYYLEDYDVANFRTDPAPDNTLGLFRRDDHSLLSLYGRFRINDFYRADTRSPQVFFDHVRKPLFDSPVLHEGNLSFGLIGEQAADLAEGTIINPLMKLKSSDPGAQSLLNQLDGYERQLAERLLALPPGDPGRNEIRTQLLDSSYARFNAYQELTMPLTFGEVFHVTPVAGVGYTRYDAENWEIANTDRTYLHAGLEASTKFSKAFDGIRNPRWGLDGLRHIVQPYAAWSFVSTDNISIEDPLVDRLTPTTRPRPLDPIRFNAIDELQSWNVVRLGTRNRLLTKRDQGAFEWLFMDTYIDGFIEDPEEQRDLSNLYNEITWQPLPWLSAGFETQFPVVSSGSGFNEYNTNLRFMPTPNLEFSINYLVLNGNPVLDDSNQIYFRSYMRLNERWGFGMLDVIELDDGTLQQQEYTLHRDFGNWVAGLGVSLVDNRIQTEYGVVFSLTLTDFPAATLPFELSAE
jgi:LPS-assembly protein